MASALDDLLADLGGDSAPAPKKEEKKAAPSSTMDDLLADLGQPAESKPAAKPASNQQSMDDLLADLDGGGKGSGDGGDVDLMLAQAGADSAGTAMDDLLAGLDEFNFDGAGTTTTATTAGTGASAPVATLDNIKVGADNATDALLKLSDLWADDDDIAIGASTAVEVEAEGEPCARCTVKFLKGEIGLAMRGYEDRGTFHKKCFLCDLCSAPIPGAYAITPDKKVACEECATGTCGKCGQTIDADAAFVTVQEVTLHKACFACNACKKELTGLPFHGNAAASYCRECHVARNAHTCGGCNQPIVSGGVSIELGPYHRECVKCDTCSVDVAAGYFKHNNRLYCRDHIQSAGSAG